MNPHTKLCLNAKETSQLLGKKNSLCSFKAFENIFVDEQ